MASQDCTLKRPKNKRISLSLNRNSTIPANVSKNENGESASKKDILNIETAIKTVNNIFVSESKKAEVKNDFKNNNESIVIDGHIASDKFKCIEQRTANCNINEAFNNEEEPMNNDLDLAISEHYSLISVSSATDIDNTLNDSQNKTIIYEKPSYAFSIALSDCKNLDVTTKNVNIKRICVSHSDQNNTNIDCEIIENSESEIEKLAHSPPKKQAVAVNLEIKNNNLSTSEDCQSKILILNTNAIEKLSHVIVQPPQYKSFRWKIQGKSKISSIDKKKLHLRSAKAWQSKVGGDKLRQNNIKNYFKNTKDSRALSQGKNARNCVNDSLVQDDMSRTVRGDTARSDGGRLSHRVSQIGNESPRSSMVQYRDIRGSNSDAPQVPSPRCKNESAGSCSPRRHLDTLHFHLPTKAKSNRSSIVPRDIPHYKIVAGTHFAVDAFCYGDIPGVKNYFLTHFHSDHYSGLKKSFNKVLYCSKITANLCMSRLGVNMKCIHIINVDETVKIDGVEVTAIDANHCPGAVMLLFRLTNGKTLLHTGDFRATPQMESHPVFWNNDIHTIYLDTTYCNPRYDFPTQEQSLDMALHILRQKKKALEDVGKKFSSVLIVCGTYTIGKEKFFLGMAKHVCCNVWACPEKDKVLQTVEGRSFSQSTPQSCQLHVVPMRDLTHEKLRCYLDSLQGAFSEVVAFKPSGWENRKNTPVCKDNVTIHGIPYSEHSSFSEMIRFVKYLKPKQVVPTVDISGGIKAVQKYFPCPLVYKEDIQYQSKLTDFFNVQSRQQISAAS